MTSRNLHHRVNALLLALLLVLAAVPAQAFPLTNEASLDWSASSLWEMFRSLVTGIWQEEGMTIDPNGATVPNSVTDPGDEGMTIDPNG